MSGNDQLRAVDALKYAAAILKARTDSALDGIAASGCGHDDDEDRHTAEIDAIRDVVAEILDLAAQFGDPRRYSDGRRVQSTAQIEGNFRTVHIWHPDAHVEKSASWRGSLLPWDEDTPSPGVFEVTTNPRTQCLNVQVVRVDEIRPDGDVE